MTTEMTNEALAVQTDAKTGVKNDAGEQDNHTSNFDSAWKDVIEELFEPFMEFFFPQAHKDIDFDRGIEILSSELREIEPQNNVGKRFADELIKVYLKDGTELCVCIFIHIEVQGRQEKKWVFPERVYIYNYRIHDKNLETGAMIVSLAILTDENRNYRPDLYYRGKWGFELKMTIPMVKIIEYKCDEKLKEKLETTDNPMAMVVKAQLKSYQLKKADDIKKSSAKWELIRQCYERGYPKKRIDSLFKFIDWIIKLPDDLDKQLSKKMHKLEEEYKMPYVTSWERMAEARGVKIGEKRGVKIGEKRGEKRGEKIGAEKERIRTARELIKNGVDMGIIVQATGFSREELAKLTETVH